ncbi:hypothetical protein CONPUDRAFT_152548 [Coniophora puteana RWD-64-598 SS2]|uniref:F-box domain-containing protein n=1 Tax=Coniophora puteana (strain RWD-64-598) TaxID=741705 RepID=A0A5M3MWT5_CONPW|nr:uncharacterized protein CONPUDRAFT_152548 [Coniophora puteana RWD-64-598 SS2]EIW83530.1 hypothetical protein CONPUDRAFT_152548 [Coniophora puteana RWD-64-598 SS2]
MHLTTTPPEVFREICQYCKGDYEGNKTLASLARTCIAFRDESLDVLWSSIPPSAFFSPLPSRTIIKEPRRPLSRRVQSIVSPLDLTGSVGNSAFEQIDFDPASVTTSEWEIFHKYTSRVRKLELNETHGVKFYVLPSLFPHYSNVERALPRLAHLNVCRSWGFELEGHGVHWEVLQVFLVSTICSLRFDPTLTEDAVDFVAMIPARSPKLETLTFSYRDVDDLWPAEVTSAFGDAVSQLPRLQEYDGPLLYHTPPRGLSSLSLLQRISLDMHFAPIQGLHLSLNSLPFPALSDLKLHITSIDNALNFLHAVDSAAQSHRFQPGSIAVHFNYVPSTEDVNNACSILSAYQRFKPLSIAFRHDPVEDDDEELGKDGVTTLEMFRPLLCNTFIKKLDSDIFRQVSLTDADIVEMGNAWPQLEVLSVNGETHAWGRSLQITLDGVQRLLKACPCLSELALSIRVNNAERNRPEWQLEQLDRMVDRRNVALRSFNDLESQIEDLTLFCIVFSQLAPNATVGPEWQQPDPLSLAVKEVQAMRQERNGCISAWSWDELDERINPFAMQPRYEAYPFMSHEYYALVDD